MIEIKMPQMGESLAEGTIVRWLKAPGERVARDEPLFEISTDKVDTDVPAPEAGILQEVLAHAGETVPVGFTVGRLEPDRRAASGASAAASASPEPETADVPPASSGHFRSDQPAHLVSFRTAAPRADPPSVAHGTPPTGPDRRRPYSPAVLEQARLGGVSLEQLTTMRGSGRGGRVTKRDVETFLTHPQAPSASTPASPEYGSPPPQYLYRPIQDDRVAAMSPIRRTIAQHMGWSTKISPHATAFGECDMTRVSEMIRRERQQTADSAADRLTYTAVAAWALVQTLREFPSFNASVVGDALAIKPYIHLGIAVALLDSDELIVPVVRAAHDLSLAGIARAIGELTQRARARTLRPDDVQGGTFTLTNPGMYGGLIGTPILNQPQVGIVSLGAITKRAVVLAEDRIAPRPMMMMSLTFDHRAADGAAAFRFLERLRQRLESDRDRT